MVPASAETFVFRYTKSSIQPATPQQPGEPGPELDDPGDYDITARFVGFLGETFSARVPIKPGVIATSWEVEEGILPQGLVLGVEEGTISGTPSEAVSGRLLKLRGYSASGEMGSRVSVTIDVLEPLPGSARQEIYAHVGKRTTTRLATLPDTTSVHEWEPLIAPPAWAAVNREVGDIVINAIEPGSWPFGFQGKDYLGRDVIATYGQIVVEDGPVIADVADQILHPESPFSVIGSVERKLGDLRWELEGDPLPRGLQFDPFTGSITGNISTFGLRSTFRLKAIDIDAAEGRSNWFVLGTRDAAVSLESVPMQHLVVGEPVSITFKVGEMFGEAHWELVAGELPSGLTLDSTTGAISGTAMTPGDFQGIQIKVITTLSGERTSNPFRIAVADRRLEVMLDPQSVAVRTTEQFQTSNPVVTGGTEPYRFELAVGQDLPDGITLDAATGILSGAAFTPGNNSVSIMAWDAADRRSNPFTVGIEAFGFPEVSFQPPEGMRRSAYSATPSSAPWTLMPPAVWSFDGTPDWIRIDPNSGRIYGTPMEAGSYGPITLTVIDGRGDVGSAGPFQIDVADLPPMELSVQDVDYPRMVQGEVKVATYRYAVGRARFTLAEGVLPTGLRLDPDGFLRGSTSETGTVSGIVVTVTDEDGRTATSFPFAITIVHPGPLRVAPVNHKTALNVPFMTEPVKVSNEVGAVAFQAVGLPSGIKLDPNSGSLSGVATTPGLIEGVLIATDAMGRTAEASVKVSVLNPLVVSSPSRVDLNRLGQTEPIHATTTEHIGTLSWSLTGDLPQGLAFDATTGAIVGTPLEEGQFSVSFAATDGAGQSAISTTLISVGPRRNPLSISYAMPTLFVGESTGLPVGPSQPTNAAGTIVFNLVQGNLPDGVIFNQETGRFAGKPERTGTFAGIVVSGTDEDGSTAMSAPISIMVTLKGAIDVPPVLKRSTRVDRYFTTDAVVLGNAQAPFSFGLADGSPWIDSELALNRSTGAISGVAYAPGVRNFDLKVADGLGRMKNFRVELSVLENLWVKYQPSYEFRQFASGQAVPLSGNVVGKAKFDLMGGSLPEGLSFNVSTGAISGIPTARGTFGPFAVRLTDDSGDEVADMFSIVVDDRMPVLVSYNLSAPLKMGKSATIQPDQPTNVYGESTWSLLAGTLPVGLSLETSSGRIKGVPIALGTWDGIIVGVTDSTGASGQNAIPFSITIEPAGQIGGPSAVSLETRKGRPFYSPSIIITDAVGGVMFSFTGGPVGVVLDSETGAFSGTLPVAGSYEWTISVIDSLGRSKDIPVAVQVLDDLVAVAGAVEGRQFSPISATPTAQNTSGGVKWSMVGTLPAGLAFDPGSGRISGIPEVAGNFPVTLTVTDGSGSTAEVSITVRVLPRLPLTAAFPAPSTTAIALSSFSFTAEVKDAVGSVIWSLYSGTLPPGLSVDAATGAITGTPEMIGTYGNIVLSVTDLKGASARTQPLEITVVLNGEPISLQVVTLQTKAGFPFVSAAPAVENAIGDIIFYAPHGLPTGASLDRNTGIVSGTFDVAGDRVIDLAVSDASNRATSVPLTIQALPHLRIVYPSENHGLVNRAYSAVVPTVQYAIGPATFELVGKLPAGLSFDTSTGRIAGTPTEIAVATGIQVIGKDSFGDVQMSNSFDLRVLDDGSIPTASLPTIPMLRVGTQMDAVVPVRGYPKTGDVFSLNKPLPLGMVLDTSTGTISGIPANGTHGVHQGFVMNVVDVNGRGTSSDPFDIQIRHPLNVGFGAVEAVSRSGLSFQTAAVPVTNADAVIGDLTFEFAGPSHGLTVSSSTGSLSGQLQDSATVLLRARDALGIVGTASVDIRIENLSLSFGLNSYDFPDGVPISFDPVTRGITGIDTVFTFVGTVPETLAVNALTGRITGTVPFGRHIVELQVADAGATATTGSVEFWGTSTAPTDFRFTHLREQENGATVVSEILPVTGTDGIFRRVSTVPSGSADICYDAKCSQIAPTKDARNGHYIRLTAEVPKGSEATLAVSMVLSGVPGIWTWAVTSSEIDIVSLVSLEAGVRSNCGLDGNGQSWCWGNNQSGLLGNGNDISQPLPVQVVGAPPFTVIGSASFSTCGLDNGGQAWCWGRNAAGQLGRGFSGEDQFEPAPVVMPSGVSFVTIYGGSTHVCALDGSGQAYCWGTNNLTSTGSGSSWVPRPIVQSASGGESALRFIRLSVGTRQTCGLTASGEAWCWGYWSGTNKPYPTKVGTTWSDIGTTNNNTSSGAVTAICGVLSNGNTQCIGDRGIADTLQIGSYVSMAMGGTHTCALDRSGKAWCWGSGAGGRLGTGDTSNSTSAVAVDGDRTFLKLVAGEAHTCGLQSSGEVWCWGMNNVGQIGDGTTSNRLTPVMMGGG